ncbi:DUF5694 domain-containing protein [Undibacterium crateris]|uniref:DUF5694 domain-containing protein n=1 Tax=Undibacterium crateris TaxID=2528175 RepID=UPI001389D40D|nr:DUF5694 domain-containing protein [Undibacterium crateris]NDI86075.1 hypothetical protein [Undibacterium crateris]
MLLKIRALSSRLLQAGLLVSWAVSATACQAAESGLLRQRSVSERPQIMLIGTSHFANYGRDVVNIESPDVLSAQRQQEIEQLCAALSAFRPTKIAVEIDARAQEKLQQRFLAYRDQAAALNKNEVQQLGFRLAARLGHQTVYAVDWNDMPPAELHHYDYESWAVQHRMQERLQAMRDTSQAKAEGLWMTQHSVADWLVKFNTPQEIAHSQRQYFDYAMLGDQNASPGANWLGHWYARNVRIFANLVRLADQPQERLLVIYGAGHVSLLRQFIQQSGAMTDIDPLPYLQQAQQALISATMQSSR